MRALSVGRKGFPRDLRFLQDLHALGVVGDGVDGGAGHDEMCIVRFLHVLGEALDDAERVL